MAGITKHLYNLVYAHKLNLDFNFISMHYSIINYISCQGITQYKNVGQFI